MVARFFPATFRGRPVSNPGMMEDQALVARVLGGDMQAFRVLIRQHERLVLHMIGRVVQTTEDQEELCQDVFVKVYEKLGEFSFQSKLSTWIATIAYRQAINHVRKKRVVSVDLPEHGQEMAAFTSDQRADELAEQDIEVYLMKMIDALPVQYKIVVTLYHLEEKSYTEIGEITGMPEGTVKNYLFRARQLLKEKATKYLGTEEWI